MSIFQIQLQIEFQANVQMKKFKIHSQLGKGSFGKVQLATHIATGDYVAIKTISKNKLKLKQDLSMVNKQIAVFKSVYHDNIIQLYQIMEDQNNLYLVMQYAEKGDLLTYIKNNGTLSQALALKFIKQLTETVDFLHSQKFIAHRDIKLANILLSSKNNTIKLADFGLSNFYDKNNQVLKTSCGSPCYSAPEILRGVKYYPIAADIWSLGIVLFAMIQGCLPFYDENVKELYRQVIKGKYCEHQKCSKQIKALIKKILEVNPQFRITITQLNKQLDILLNKYDNKLNVQIPKLNQQSNIYVENLKKEKIIKILVNNGYEQNQVRNTIEYKQKTKKSRKFNDLNTFFEILNKKKLNQINSILKKCQQDSKQNEPLKVSPINPLKQLKRTNSNFTKDSTPEVKQPQNVRFVRNTNQKTNLKIVRLNKLVQSQRRQLGKKTRDMSGPFEGLAIHRKKLELVSQDKINRQYECKDITKEYSSLLTSIGQSNEGYIRLKNNNHINSVNLSFVTSEANTNITNTRRLKRTKDRAAYMSVNDKNYFNLKLNKEMEQNSIDLGLQEENKTYRTDILLEDIQNYQIFTPRDIYEVNTSLGLDQLEDQQLYMEIQRQPFNIMHTYKGRTSIRKLQQCLEQFCLKENVQKQKIGNYKYRIKRETEKKQTIIQVLKVQAFTNLKLIKILPFNSVVLSEIKKILNNIS